jgi:hypothetical protein
MEKSMSRGDTGPDTRSLKTRTGESIMPSCKLVVLLTALAPLASCSDPATTTADSGTPGACTTLVNSAPAIVVTTGDAAVSTGTGGTVAAGTYYLTAVVRTPSSIMPQMRLRQTLRISGNTIESVSQDNDLPANNDVTTFTTNGSSIVFTGICSTKADSGGSLEYDSYTADGTHLVLYAVTLGITVTFTRQG